MQRETLDFDTSLYYWVFRQTLKQGKVKIKTGSGLLQGPYTVAHVHLGAGLNIANVFFMESRHGSLFSISIHDYTHINDTYVTGGWMNGTTSVPKSVWH